MTLSFDQNRRVYERLIPHRFAALDHVIIHDVIDDRMFVSLNMRPERKGLAIGLPWPKIPVSGRIKTHISGATLLHTNNRLFGHYIIS